ncbi:MAG: PEP-CTERM sorting domain-containing protein [Planctomycetota bacterium]|nr:MAG: PEP-CTERM sorting domain-containing protein [Planctomycetota bacterium]
MKRLLALFMILALASTADAALSYYLESAPAVTPLEIPTNEVITIQIYSSDTSNWLGFAVQQDTGVASTMVGWLSNGRSYYGDPNLIIIGNAGESGGYSWYDEPGWAKSGYEFRTQTISGQVEAGIQHAMDYSSSEVGTTRIGLFRPPNYSWYADELSYIDITVVPEPMTMGLLALGGVALLRRRRK